MSVQLAQKKTPGEQQWAELKALSWPPWKQERTAMDALITAEDHGLTRAGDTLRRMREAGYAAGEWERTAELLAGWDIDRTPTIQTRASMGIGVRRFRSGAEVWAARITTTRTAQEAWAAYLAFEDAGNPPSHDVHLAILQKLYQEERRQRLSTVSPRRRSVNGDDRVLPGDRKEVEPLPPSTHLYTYTRTAVPTVENFFRQHLQQNGIKPQGHCLAFLITNAASLQLGFEYLRHSRDTHSSLHGLLSLDPSADVSAIPDSVFSALIQLLCRYANVPLHKISGKRYPVSRKVHTPPLLEKLPLNIQHPLVYALELLNLRRTTSRPPWNSVLRAFSHNATVESMRFLAQTHLGGSHDENAARNGKSRNGTMLAHRLVRRVLSMLSEAHLDLDVPGFHCVCLSTENVTLACWRILREDVAAVSPPEETTALEVNSDVLEANDLLRKSYHVRRLRKLFGVLVGDEDTPVFTHADADERRKQPAWLGLLATPSPALLHAYIRALGWLGDHNGLLATVKWMVQHKAELTEEAARHRNAKDMMRRTLTALRVFLERSWLVDVQINATELSEEEGMAQRNLRVKNLRRLETAAPSEILQEAEQLVDGIPHWQGWPSDDEVEDYCADGRFLEVRKMYEV